MELLERKKITASPQMLRRWIRQGKILATMKSRKQGYEIDGESLEQFILLKQIDGADPSIKKTGAYQKGYNDGFTAGLKESTAEAVRRREVAVKAALKDREQELIQIGLYLDYFIIPNNTKLPVASQQYMNAVDAKKFTFRILGSWALVEETRDLIDIDYLAYPNRKLQTRLRDWIKEQTPAE